MGREHKQIFGKSVCPRTIKNERKQARLNGTYHELFEKKKDDLRFTKRDTWNEVKQNRKQSNWKFMDGDQDEPQNAKRGAPQKYNRKYRGNGNINYGKNNRRNPEHPDYRPINNNPRGGQSGPRLNSFQKAAIEYDRIKQEHLERRKERELNQERREKALRNAELRRKRREKIFEMRNRKGQPNLNMQMHLLLQKIQNKKKWLKRKQEQEEQEREEVSIGNNYGPPSDNRNHLNFEDDADDVHESGSDVGIEYGPP